MQGQANILRLTFTVEVEVPAFLGEREAVTLDFEQRVRNSMNDSLFFYPHHIKRVGVLDTPPVLEPSIDPQVIVVARKSVA